jgi:NADP-dependent 3-hydroxy acid dehydrogenase YdfG
MYLEKLRLDGRIAVVTGAGQGIGAACARALGEAGATVIVAELLADRVSASVAELKRLGIAAHGTALDVTKSADVDRVADTLIKEFRRIDILVNNAGKG